jgi:hypothetical protein
LHIIKEKGRTGFFRSRHAKKRVSLENPIEFAKRNCLFLSIIMKDVYMCGKVEYIILYHDKKRTGTIFVPA